MLGKVERKLALNTSELVDIHICVIYKYVLLIYDPCIELACIFHIRYIKCSFRKLLNPLF